MNATAEKRDFCFDEGTPEEVQRILRNLYATHRGQRIRIALGDPQTGRDWGEDYGTIGYIGRSTGNKPIALLINNKRSYGGTGLLTANILRIVDIRTGRELYRHPKYHAPKYQAVNGSDQPGYCARVVEQIADQSEPAEVYANCESFEQAQRLAAFMNWERHSK